MADKEYCYSFNGEWYYEFDIDVKTRDEAISEAQKIMNNGNNCDTLWIAIKNTVSPNDVIPDLADHAIEMIVDNAFDNYGEFAEDYLMNVSIKQTDELDVEIRNVIINWMEKHSLQPTFYLVENAEIVHKNKERENNDT